MMFRLFLIPFLIVAVLVGVLVTVVGAVGAQFELGSGIDPRNIAR